MAFDTKLMEYVLGEFICQNKIKDYDKFISEVSENSLQKLILIKNLD